MLPQKLVGWALPGSNFNHHPQPQVKACSVWNGGVNKIGWGRVEQDGDSDEEEGGTGT